MSPARENDLVSSIYARTSVIDFECLCDIDVLGVEENHLRRMCIKNSNNNLREMRGLIRDRSRVD